MSDDAIVIALGCLTLLVIFFVIWHKPILAFWDQKMTDRKRERAHAGKVQCEETKERCENTATVLTHKGYFCPIHWEENSKHEVPGGGYVTWHHVLYHSIRRN